MKQEKEGDMDDNVRNPKNKVEAKDEVTILVNLVSQTNEKYKSKRFSQGFDWTI